MRVAEVVNIARAVEELKELGVWSVGLAEEAGQVYDRGRLDRCRRPWCWAPRGPGCAGWCAKRCDLLVSIPMAGHVGSLNVSVAARGMVLFEAVRQRDKRRR